MKTKEFNISQITPANGFNAVFANDDATVFTRPIACWALSRRMVLLDEDDWEHLEKIDLDIPPQTEGERGKPIEINRVEGMVCNGTRELVPCESEDYFLGYIGPGEHPLDFQEKARDLIDSFGDDEDDVEDLDLDDESDESLTDSLPQALSHLSVQVQESIRLGKMPTKWEQGGWLEFMKRFGDLSGG
jgi:hypothetical protein